MILRHIPNILTFFRLILIGPFLASLYQQEYPAALCLFILAGFTDALDGWLARYFHWQSALGSFLDPLADKLLIAVSFISLSLIGMIPYWLVILVFSRDLTITLGVLAWHYLIREKLVFSPTRLSKFNTLFQLTLVTLCLFELSQIQFPPYLIHATIGLTAITTTGTYIDYVWTWGKKAYFHTYSTK